MLARRMESAIAWDNRRPEAWAGGTGWFVLRDTHCYGEFLLEFLNTVCSFCFCVSVDSKLSPLNGRCLGSYAGRLNGCSDIKHHDLALAFDMEKAHNGWFLPTIRAAMSPWSRLPIDARVRAH